jgi:hypothetical protein
LTEDSAKNKEYQVIRDYFFKIAKKFIEDHFSFAATKKIELRMWE